MRRREERSCAGLLEVIKRKKGPYTHTHTHTTEGGIKSIKNWETEGKNKRY